MRVRVCFPESVSAVDRSECQHMLRSGLPLHHPSPPKYSLQIRKPATSAQPAQRAERGPFFFFLILLSAPAISARPPASHLIHSVTSFLLFSFLLPPPGSVFKIQPDFFVASMAFLGGLFCQLMLFAAFIVIDSCFCLSFSLLFSSPPRLHIP